MKFTLNFFMSDSKEKKNICFGNFENEQSKIILMNFVKKKNFLVFFLMEIIFFTQISHEIFSSEDFKSLESSRNFPFFMNIHFLLLKGKAEEEI